MIPRYDWKQNRSIDRQTRALRRLAQQEEERSRRERARYERETKQLIRDAQAGSTIAVARLRDRCFSVQWIAELTGRSIAEVLEASATAMKERSRERPTDPERAGE
jgi:hypothetical protein